MNEAGAVVKLSLAAGSSGRVPSPRWRARVGSRGFGMPTRRQPRAPRRGQERYTFSHSLTHPPTNPCPFFPRPACRSMPVALTSELRRYERAAGS